MPRNDQISSVPERRSELGYTEPEALEPLNNPSTAVIEDLAVVMGIVEVLKERPPMDWRLCLDVDELPDDVSVHPAVHEQLKQAFPSGATMVSGLRSHIAVAYSFCKRDPEAEAQRARTVFRTITGMQPKNVHLYRMTEVHDRVAELSVENRLTVVNRFHDRRAELDSWAIDEVVDKAIAEAPKGLKLVKDQ